MTELVRWNDDRLDDLAGQVRINMKTLEEQGHIREELVAIRERQATMADDTHECRSEITKLKADLASRDRTQRAERKSDFKWMVITLLTVAGLVVAALGIFVG